MTTTYCQPESIVTPDGTMHFTLIPLPSSILNQVFADCGMVGSTSTTLPHVLMRRPMLFAPTAFLIPCWPAGGVPTVAPPIARLVIAIGLSVIGTFVR